MDVFEDRTLFRLDWDASQDRLFQCILEHLLGTHSGVQSDGPRCWPMVRLERATVRSAHACRSDGYYDIPRGCTTEELADELRISDQAVTERLRRAIGAFARHTLLTPEPEP